MIPSTSFWNITGVAHIFASMPPDSQATQSRNNWNYRKKCHRCHHHLINHVNVTFRTGMWDTISMLLWLWESINLNLLGLGNVYSFSVLKIDKGLLNSILNAPDRCTEPQMCHRGRSQFLVVPGRYSNGLISAVGKCQPVNFLCSSDKQHPVAK